MLCEQQYCIFITKNFVTTVCSVNSSVVSSLLRTSLQLFVYTSHPWWVFCAQKYVNSENCQLVQKAKFVAPSELLVVSSWQQYWRLLSGVMYILIGIILILFAVWYRAEIQRKIPFKQVFKATGYQAYYYLLGGRGILEDYVYFGHNKTRMYIDSY